MNATNETTSLDRAMTRRGALKLFGGIAATLVGGGVFARGAGATSGPASFRTTAALNLRAQPSTSGKILLVIPKGAEVANLGASSNGYFKVRYKNTDGWAYSTFLEQIVPNPDSVDPDYRILGEAFTDRSVNLRSGPSTDFTVRRVLDKNTRVSYSNQLQNGFRYVILDGYLYGWVFDDFLGNASVEGPVSFRTDRDANLRAEPNQNAASLRVVPKGATVTDYDLVMSNGYRGVDYKGTRGWIYDGYLDRIG